MGMSQHVNNTIIKIKNSLYNAYNMGVDDERHRWEQKKLESMQEVYEKGVIDGQVEAINKFKYGSDNRGADGLTDYERGHNEGRKQVCDFLDKLIKDELEMQFLVDTYGTNDWKLILEENDIDSIMVSHNGWLADNDPLNDPTNDPRNYWGEEKIVEFGGKNYLLRREAFTGEVTLEEVKEGEKCED